MGKMKLNIPMFAALILLLLTMVSTHFTSGLYAKYSAYAEGQDSARVAVFAIETDLDRIALGTGEKPELQLGGDGGITSVELPFYISSESEVTVAYSVTVDFDEKNVPPDYLRLTLSNGTNSQTLAADGSKNQFVFSDFGTLPAATSGEERVDLVLTISVSDLAEITDEVSMPTAKLTVSVYQVD